MRGELGLVVLLLFASANLAVLGVVQVGNDIGFLLYAVVFLLLVNLLVASGAWKLVRAGRAPSDAARRELVDSAMARIFIPLGGELIVWLALVLNPDRMGYSSWNSSADTARILVQLAELTALPFTGLLLVHYLRTVGTGKPTLG